MVGEMIGHYRVIERARQDAMGVTYKAEGTKLGREAILESWRTIGTPDETELPSHLRALEVVESIQEYTFSVRPCLRQVGYWKGGDRGNRGLPDPADFVDPAWDLATRAATTEYLRAGEVYLFCCGLSPCRFCGCGNGNKDLTNGFYLWPEGLAHYLERHTVRLPDEFVDHTRKDIRYKAELFFGRDRSWWMRARI